MTIRAVILWVHVLCGVLWVGACATFILAAAVLAGEPDESLAFARRAVPQINRLCLPPALVIPLTGLVNLLFVARSRSVLPSEFLGILAAKVGFLVAMCGGLFRAWRTVAMLQRLSATGHLEALRELDIRRISASYGIIVACGVAALGLGLWLSGT